MVKQEILEHIDAAIAELDEASGKAGVGTTLMIRDPNEDLKNLRVRLENIVEEQA